VFLSLFEGDAFNASDANSMNRNYDGEWWIKQNRQEYVILY